MKFNSVYTFDDAASTGIIEVPVNGMILIKDDGLGPRVLVKTVQSAVDDVAGFIASGNYIDLQLDTDSELEKIIEGANTGHRILGKNTANYGDIGQDAVDLSHSDTASGLMGATGETAFAANKSTEASGVGAFAAGVGTAATGNASFAAGLETSVSIEAGAVFGKYNASKVGTIFEVGAGADNATRSNIFECDPSCKVVRAPMTEITDLDSASGKSLVTKEYLDLKTMPLPLPFLNEVIDSTVDTDGFVVWNASLPTPAWVPMDVLDFGTY